MVGRFPRKSGREYDYDAHGIFVDATSYLLESVSIMTHINYYFHWSQAKRFMEILHTELYDVLPYQAQQLISGMPTAEDEQEED